MNTDTKQVHMAPFRLIFIQDGSHTSTAKPLGCTPALKPPHGENTRFDVFLDWLSISIHVHVFSYHPCYKAVSYTHLTLPTILLV